LHAPMFYIPGVLKAQDGRWLARSIRERVRTLRSAGRAEVIDAHFGYPEGVGCALIANELELPYFITIRGLETDVLQRPSIGEQLLRALHGASGIISVSHSLRDLVAARGVNPDRILVAPNAVDRTLFNVGVRAEARERLNVPGDQRLIVCVGHLLSVKRHTVLLDAFARLRERTPARLVIIGGESHEPQYPALLHAQVARAGLADSVLFAGKLSPAKVAEWLHAADLFALASAREGCCNAVLEALAAGVAVVATHVGDNAYLVKDGINGYLVPPEDGVALAQALHVGLARRWDHAAISTHLNVGTWEDTASRVLDFMEARRAVRGEKRRECA